MLAIVCAGVVLASLDLFIVNVALPQMARDFHLRGDGLADLSWVLNAYAIVYASLLVLFGRLAERYRRERGFLLGVAVFVAASAACGAATSLPMLVAFRVLQAAGAALLTPTSLGLILATTTPERRARRGPDLDRGRRPGRGGAGPVVGGAAGGGELALGVPGQRADRPARAGRRLAAAAAGAGPPGPAPDALGAAADHRRRRRARARAWSKAARGAGATPRTIGALAAGVVALAAVRGALRRGTATR